MLDEFVDFENGKCDFDGIRTLLDICTNSKILAVPGFTDPKSLAEKKLLFAPVYYFDLGYFWHRPLHELPGRRHPVHRLPDNDRESKEQRGQAR